MSGTPAGGTQLDVQEGTFRQEPGSGVCGQVQGASVAVGNLEWVRSHSQPTTATSASTSTTPSDTHTSSSHAGHKNGVAVVADSSSYNTSGNGQGERHAVDDSQRGGSEHRGGGEQVSTSGRSDGVDTGMMTVYVGVNGSLAGVFEIRDQLRPDAAATIRGLQQQGIDTILLSGKPCLMLILPATCLTSLVALP